jgi:Holliday junction resolvasome RuvABC endonuclease subunit
MASVLGCDYSTHSVDLVYLDEDTLAARWHSIPLERGIAGVRAIRHAYAWQEKLEDVYLVAIEDPFSAGRTSAKQLGRVCGAILASLPTEHEVWLMRPDEWRMACGLAGNAGKLLVADWVRERVPEVELWSQDACDAYAMAYAAREINARAVEVA